MIVSIHDYMLEFICAQAPHTMKGLLIGIWYTMLSIQYLCININLSSVGDSNQWTIYSGVKGLGMFISLALYSVVCKFYHYRERNEIVNKQAMIKEVYKRELLGKHTCQSRILSVK